MNEKHEGKAKLDIVDCSDDTISISDASDSYEMVEYGLNPYEMKKLRQSRRKSCLCWHPDVIFNEREDSESVDTFSHDFMARMDHNYTDTEVTLYRVSKEKLPLRFWGPLLLA